MSTLISILPYIQIASAVLLIIAVLLQRNEASAGGAFGGGDNWNAGFRTRRGFEQTLFNITIILGVVFAVSALVNILVK